MGSCTAGGAYVPAMSDETIIRAQPGDDLSRRSATGESGHPARGQRRGPRGGDVHTPPVGGADHLAHDGTARRSRWAPDRGQTRAAAARLGRTARSGASSARPAGPVRDRAERCAPAVRLPDADRADRRPQEFDEFKHALGRRWSRGLPGFTAFRSGFLANNGILFSDSAQKGGAFHRACCQRATPLVFLPEHHGFMVGRKVESEGIARHGAKLVGADRLRPVPKFTVIVGLFRRRQLRHVRGARIRRAAVMWAERPHFGDGW